MGYMSLSDDDRKFIREVVETSEGRVRDYVRDYVRDVVRTEVEGSEERMRAHVRTVVRAEVEQSSAKLREYVYDVETTLLTEFHKWASPTEARMRSHSAALQALDAELEALKDRVKRLEEKK